MVPTHEGVPGVHSHARQVPALHDWPAAQDDATQPRPSAAQVSSAPAAPPVWQRVAPGAQTRARHAPSRQPSAEPQGTSELPCPSALHTLRAVADAQTAEPGAQVHGAQAPVAAAQPVMAAQAKGVYPSPSPLHWRRDAALAQE